MERLTMSTGSKRLALQDAVCSITQDYAAFYKTTKKVPEYPRLEEPRGYDLPGVKAPQGLLYTSQEICFLCKLIAKLATRKLND